MGLYTDRRNRFIGPADRARAREEDLALARRAATGDRTALHAVVDRNSDALFRLARGMCPTAADAEDAVQDTLVAAFRAIGTFDGRSTLLTWMSRILVRRIHKLAKKWTRHRRSTVPLDEVRDALVVQGPDLDCRLDLSDALPKLPPEFREVILLRELQGLAYSEIAELLEIPAGTVESRIHRARQKLREHLSAYRK